MTAFEIYVRLWITGLLCAVIMTVLFLEMIK